MNEVGEFLSLLDRIQIKNKIIFVVRCRQDENGREAREENPVECTGEDKR